MNFGTRLNLGFFAAVARSSAEEWIAQLRIRPSCAFSLGKVPILETMTVERMG